jgi:hypothetical protein
MILSQFRFELRCAPNGMERMLRLDLGLKSTVGRRLPGRESRY